jgi:hypothetical protein
MVVVDKTSAKKVCRGCSVLSHQSPDDISVVTPMIFEGRVLGVLSGIVPQSIEFDEEELGLFQELAGDIGFALNKLEVCEQKAWLNSPFMKAKSAFGRSPKAPMSGYGRLIRTDCTPIAARPWNGCWDTSPTS